MALSLGGVALVFVAGRGLVSTLPALGRLSLAGRLGAAWLLGVAWIGGVPYAASHALGWELRRTLFLAVAAVPLATGLAMRLARGRPRSAETPRLPASRRVALLLGAAAVAAGFVGLVLLVDTLSRPIYDFDGRATWFTAARFVRGARSVDAPVLRDPRYDVGHPRYPLLLPVAQVAVFEVFGLPDDDRTPRPLYAAFFPASVLLLFEAARRWAGRGPAAAAVLLVAATPYLTTYSDGGPVSGYSDFPLAGFAGGGLALLALFRRGISGRLAAGLLLAAGALTKNEGVVYALAILGGTLVVSLRSARKGSRLRAAAGLWPAALPVVAALALLLSWKSGIVNRQDEEYVKALGRGAPLHAAAERLAAAAPAAVASLFAPADWGFFWVAVPIVLLVGSSALRRAPAGRLTPGLVGPPAIALLSYALSADARGLAGVTASRLAIHLFLPLLLLFAVALRRVAQRAFAPPAPT